MQDFATARKWYEAAAAQGNVSAMVNLGQLHYLGHGTPQNYARAAEWFAKAAEKGHPRAINNLGMAYLDGMGVEMDRKKAGQYFIRAAKLGNAHAQYNLATLYVQHPDVLTAADRTKTDALALQWFRKSAANGHPAAMEYLADVYRYGKLGQRKNPKLAESWQKKADAMLEKEKAAQAVLPLPQGSPSTPPAPSGTTDGPAKEKTAGPADKYDEDWLK